MFHSGYPRVRDRPPLLVRTDPKFGVNLILRDDFACEDVTSKEVVVHRLGDDLGNGRRVELNEAVVF